MNALLLAIAALGSSGETPVAKNISPKLLIHVQEAVQVRGTHFSVGDVVTVSGGKEELWEKVMTIPVGYSPSPGYERRMLRESVGDLIAAAGVSRSEFRMLGYPVVSVTVESKIVEPAQLQKEAQAFLESELKSRGVDEFQIEARNSPLVAQVPVGKQGVRLESSWRGEPKDRGLIGVDLRVYVDEELYNVVPLSFWVKRFGLAAIASRSTSAGELLGSENVAFKRVELPTGKAQPVLSQEELIGKAGSRAFREGELLLQSDLKNVILVVKDQDVLLSGRSGGLTISMRGIARSEGYYGSVIPVENPESQKSVFARVVGPGRVEFSIFGKER